MSDLLVWVVEDEMYPRINIMGDPAKPWTQFIMTPRQWEAVQAYFAERSTP